MPITKLFRCIYEPKTNDPDDLAVEVVLVEIPVVETAKRLTVASPANGRVRRAVNYDTYLPKDPERLLRRDLHLTPAAARDEFISEERERIREALLDLGRHGDALEAWATATTP